MNMMELIKTRKSVRTFDGRLLSEEDKKALVEYTETITNPYGIPVEFVFLDAEEHGLSSPVINGEHLYVAGKVKMSRIARRHLDTLLKNWCFTHGREALERHGSAAR